MVKATTRKTRKPSKNLKRMVQSIVARNIETKHKTTVFASFSVPSGTTYLNPDMCTIGAGDATNQRVGNSIFSKSLALRLNVINFSPLAHLFRIALVIPRQETSTDPFLGSYAANIDLDQFTVLYDRMIPIGQSGGNSEKVLTFGKRFRGRGMHMQWTDGTLGTPKKNGVYLAMISSGSGIEVFGQYQHYYKDG